MPALVTSTVFTVAGLSVFAEPFADTTAGRFLLPIITTVLGALTLAALLYVPKQFALLRRMANDLQTIRAEVLPDGKPSLKDQIATNGHKLDTVTTQMADHLAVADKQFARIDVLYDERRRDTT